MGDKFFLVVGILLALVGAFVASADIFARFRCRIKCEGTIDSLKVGTVLLCGSKVQNYQPIINYTVDKDYYGEAPVSSYRENKYKEGDKIVIHYNEKKPSEFYMKAKLTTILPGLAIFSAGVALIVVYFL